MQISDKTRAGIKPALFGAIGGAIALAVVGFTWGGWMLGSKAQQMANTQTEKALVAALIPACAEKFMAQPDATVRKVALGKVDSWKRRDEFKGESVKWVTLPGGYSPNSDLIDGCVGLILTPSPTAAVK